MMKTNLLFFLAFSNFTLLFANENIAEDTEKNYYIGASLEYERIYNHDPELIKNSKTQDNLTGLTLILGYQNLFDSYTTNGSFSLGLEGRITKSFLERSFADSTRYSIFAKPQYNFYKNKNIKNLNLYGLLGFGQLTVEGYNDDEAPAHENMIGKNIYSDVSFQWGVGISAVITKNFSLFVDYTSIINDADIDSTLYASDSKIYKELSADALNIGLTYKFN